MSDTVVPLLKPTALGHLRSFRLSDHCLMGISALSKSREFFWRTGEIKQLVMNRQSCGRPKNRADLACRPCSYQSFFKETTSNTGETKRQQSPEDKRSQLFWTLGGSSIRLAYCIPSLAKLVTLRIYYSQFANYLNAGFAESCLYVAL